jgi:UDP-N-acetylmuramate: L-alanyl-gamma-D-glutamyl-meso-diaminopimelate ligase
VLAVAGTHGKTTTASMLTHILAANGLAPGWLIGGIAADLGRSACLGGSRWFVLEADEYDSAFFDKRSKFIHYRPRTLIINNLEFDHADIFDDLAAIQRQFHHLIRIVPGSGRIIHNAADAAVGGVIEQGCWSLLTPFNTPDGWHAEPLAPDYSRLRVYRGETAIGELAWPIRGAHNAVNACAAIAAAGQVGVPPAAALAALADFHGVKRRLELRGRPRGIAVYDDFAHHPTAIRSTLEGLAAGTRNGRILVAFEPRSNTMRSGVHTPALAASFAAADKVYGYDHGLAWDFRAVMAPLGERFMPVGGIDAMVAAIAAAARPGDTVVVMSNGGFGGIQEKLLESLEEAK